ncbi:DNA mismatch endonuclease vsr [Moorella glycerini]|uniref:Very short patch repair protein n=2 Tax=Neomoorella stamsii TaxID=1266720 RepID=A0A9X7J648_9FIRM|nr:Very short patch repair protein [Moorella stamsii]CEP67127.1 DNA mismatch endonuclease vsr [Moorella glycerini]
MASVRSKNTKLELRLKNALMLQGLKPLSHDEYVTKYGESLVGSPDAIFPEARLAIFCDGCFWHGCPLHYQLPATRQDFWRKKIEENIARDRRVDAALTTAGWRVKRIWGHELKKKNLDRVVEDIIKLLNNPTGF